MTTIPTVLSDSQAFVFQDNPSHHLADTVFFTIFPDSSLTKSTSSPSSIQSLQLQILDVVYPYTSCYLWQHEPFSLSISCDGHVSHLRGKVRYGDNIEDEWFTVFLLFEISREFRTISVRVWDSDGEFLLIEAAFHLPRWINPENSGNRVFIRGGDLHIVPKRVMRNPKLVDSLKFLVNHEGTSRAGDSIQSAIKNRICEYPERARHNMHVIRVKVPISVAWILKQEPCLVSLAVEAFYDRDVDTMKYAGKMEKFLGKGNEEEMVCMALKVSRTMYLQLMQQKFHAPKCYPMPCRGNDSIGYLEAELGMKIACGLEMMYQQRRRYREEGKGTTWDVYKDSLNRSGYFEGLLPGSNEYKRLLQNAEEYYRKSALFWRTSEAMSGPVRKIDEILALAHSAEDFINQEIPPSDDDSWLYDGENELSTVLEQRQKEMDNYYETRSSKHQSKYSDMKHSSWGGTSANCDLSHVAKMTKEFVDKVSSYKGAELPENSNLKGVSFDVDRLLKDMELVMNNGCLQDIEMDADAEAATSSSSEMTCDESENESHFGGASEEGDCSSDTFSHAYAGALNEELKNTTLEKSFLHVNEQVKKQEENLNTREAGGEDLSLVDVDLNLVKGLVDSFSSQQGHPGPASNLLGLLGVQLPCNADR